MTENRTKDSGEFLIPEEKLGLLSMQMFFPFTIFSFAIYYLVWKEQFHSKNMIAMLDAIEAWSISLGIGVWWGVTLLFISGMLIFTLGIVLHELIHGIAWIWASGLRDFKYIKFGILKASLTPYCHCTEPMKRNPYITGAVMPAIILGIITLLIGLIYGNIPIFLFGYFFTLAAIGDFVMIYYLVRYVDENSNIQDHPSKIGFIVES